MQLILDCETTAEINNKMTTIDETSVISNGNIEHLNSHVKNRNKENIQLIENIIKMQDNSVIGSEKEDTNMDIADVSPNNDEDDVNRDQALVNVQNNEEVSIPNNIDHIRSKKEDTNMDIADVSPNNDEDDVNRDQALVNVQNNKEISIPNNIDHIRSEKEDTDMDIADVSPNNDEDDVNRDHALVNVQNNEEVSIPNNIDHIRSEKEDTNMDIANVSPNNDEDDVNREQALVNVQNNEEVSIPNSSDHTRCDKNVANDQNYQNNVDYEENARKDEHNDILKETNSCKYIGDEINNEKDESSCSHVMTDISDEAENSKADNNKLLNTDNDAVSNTALRDNDTTNCEDACINTNTEIKNEKQNVNDDSIKCMNKYENYVSLEDRVSTSNEESKENEINTLASEAMDEEDFSSFNVDMSTDALNTELIQKQSSKDESSENASSSVSAGSNTKTLEVKNDTMECDDIKNISENALSGIEKSNILESIKQESMNECDDTRNISERPSTLQEFIIQKKTQQESEVPIIYDTMECDNIKNISQQAMLTLQESNILETIKQQSILSESEAAQSIKVVKTVQESSINENESSNVQESNVMETVVQKSTRSNSEAGKALNEEVTEQKSTISEMVSSTVHDSNNLEGTQGSEVRQIINEDMIVEKSQVQEPNVNESNFEESTIRETSGSQEITVDKTPDQKNTFEELAVASSKELAVEELNIQESTAQETNSNLSSVPELKVDEVIVENTSVHHSAVNSNVKETAVKESMKSNEDYVVPEIKVKVQDVESAEVIPQPKEIDVLDSTSAKPDEELKPKEIVVPDSTSAKPSITGSIDEVTDMANSIIEDFNSHKITVKDILIQETASEDAVLQISSDLEAVEPQSCEIKSSIQNILEQEVTLTESKTESVIGNNDITEIIESNENKRKREEDVSNVPKKLCKLSNTLDIFSDDEENAKNIEPKNTTPITTAKSCIDLADDDDIMVIDEISSKITESKITENVDSITALNENICKTNDSEINTHMSENTIQIPSKLETLTTDSIVDSEVAEKETKCIPTDIKPLLQENFLKSHIKNLADMSRDELEEFCVLKIVESIVDRSCLSEIKSKLKTMAQSIDEYKRKAQMLTRQNRDLQVVLKSVQEDQKKQSGNAVTPLKITRSVGVQVILHTDKSGIRRKPPASLTGNNNANNKSPRAQANQSPKTSKPTEKPGTNQIPVPRLIPANNPAAKANVTLQNGVTNVPNKTPNSPLNLPKPSPPKQSEKRPHNKVQSVTVDLTDDEPPPKLTPRSSPVPPVRLVSPQNLLAPQRQPFNQPMNSPRKVYIPIGGPQGVRPGQTIMLKTLPAAPRQRYQTQQLTPRMPQNPLRMQRLQGRHPAPLPDVAKQYQPPNWKALPPAPDLKLSKVDNGIVISWKIDGYQEDAYEEIASYQLYAYQENSLPPSTTLWKKIGDVKALPLPMACTLTQFMAGFKYYFAVRAVDIRSRLGPFSLPGSILLLNKI